MARVINGTHVLIHAAKTGGTFFREMMNRAGVPNYELGDKHITLPDFKSINDRSMKFTFMGFVRTPVTWYRSRWAYAMMTYFGPKLKAFPPEHPIHKHWMARVWSENINDFIYNTLDLYPNGVATEYFEKMFGENFGIGDPRIHIYKFEDLPEVISLMLNEFGKPVSYSDIRTMPKELSSQHITASISGENIRSIIETESKLLNAFY